MSSRLLGAVHVIRATDSFNSGAGGSWRVHLPDGSILDTTGSLSQGLQESIDVAARCGFDHYLHGGCVKPPNWPIPYASLNGQDPSIINCAAPIVFPPLQRGKFHWGSVTLNCTHAGAAALRFDSVMAADFSFEGGQIVAPNVANVVLFKPEHELPQDGAGPVVTQSHFKIPSTIAGPGKTCIRFDATLAPIRGAKFEFMEPNGGAFGIFVAARHAFSENVIDATGMHAQSSVCVENGGDAESAPHIHGNHWAVTCAPLTGATGFDQWGSRDLIRLTVTDLEGLALRGVTLEACAQRNIIDAACLRATMPILDASGGTTNLIRATC